MQCAVQSPVWCAVCSVAGDIWKPLSLVCRMLYSRLHTKTLLLLCAYDGWTAYFIARAEYGGAAFKNRADS